MKLLNALLVALIIFCAFKYNIIVGILATVIIIALAIFYFVPQILRARARMAFAKGEFDEAERWFRLAMRTKRANADTRMEYAYVLLRTGKVDEAEQAVSELLRYKLKPQTRAKAIIQRCMCYYKRGNLDEAIHDATELYNDGYRSINLYEMLGYFKILKDPMSQETFDFCAEAYDYADDDRDIRDNMLICYYNRGEYEKAKEISDKVLENNPPFVEAWYHAAQIDNKLGNYADAAEKLTHIKDCHRSYMTTVSEREVSELEAEVKGKIR
ncbi:MAG: tetratricopeptide repeat protein [Clostridia bacterium]|nr:tetratricopeptide repeat protein [Clostridia bacterium]